MAAVGAARVPPRAAECSSSRAAPARTPAAARGACRAGGATHAAAAAGGGGRHRRRRVVGGAPPPPPELDEAQLTVVNELADRLGLDREELATLPAALVVAELERVRQAASGA